MYLGSWRTRDHRAKGCSGESAQGAIGAAHGPSPRFDSRSCMAYKQAMANVQALADVRAVREPGKRMRSRLLDAAVELFKLKGLSAVSVAEIAAAAGAYPSQVTYYFRTKEALFVEAACREVLYVARQAELAAG